MMEKEHLAVSEKDRDSILKELNAETVNEVLPCGIVVVGLHPDYSILYANDYMINMLGYQDLRDMLNCLEGKAISYVYWKDREDLLLKGASRNGNNQVYSLDYRVLRKDKRVCWVNQRSRHLFLKDGREVIMGCYTDITSRKELEEKRETMISAIPGGVAQYKIVNGVCHEIYSSDGVAALTGHTKKEYQKIIEKGSFELFYEKDRGRAKEALEKIVNEKQDFENMIRKVCVDGTIIWVRVHLHYSGEEDGCPIIYAVYHNASAETSMTEDVLKANDAGIVIQDVNTHEILYTNEAALSIARSKDKDYVGKCCYSFLWNSNCVCKGCRIEEVTVDKPVNQIRYEPESQRYYSSEIKRMTWFGRDVVTEFIVDITEQAREHKLLRQNSAILRQAIDDANLISWKYDLRIEKLVNQNAILRRSGYVENESNLPETQIADGYIAEESIEDCRTMYREIRAGRKTVGGKIWYNRRRNPADKRCLKISYTVTMDEDGKPAIATGLAQDITEQQNQYLIYQRRIDSIMQSTPEVLGSFVMNITRNYVTEQVAKYSYIDTQMDYVTIDQYFLGLREHFSLDSEYETYCHLFSRENLMEEYHLGKTKVTYTHHYVFKYYSERYISTVANIIQNPNTRELEVIMTAADVTDITTYRKIARQLVNHKYDIVALIYPEQDKVEFRFVNNEYSDIAEVKIMNYEENRMTSARELFDPSQKKVYEECTRLSVILSNLEKTGKYSFINYRMVNGEKRIKNYTYVYLDDCCRIILCVVQDITALYAKEEKQLAAIETALQEAKHANAAKSEFLSRMSHDIRTPMNAIINMTRFAREDYKKGGAVLDDLDKVEMTSTYLLGLINDILDVSRIESGKMELHPVVYSYNEFANYISCMINPLCEKKNLTFKWNRTRSSRPIYIDKIRFNQMVFNLLSNAVKYTPDGGTITLREHDIIKTDRYIETSFSISDTGCGMSQEFQSQMFNPFARAAGTDEIQGTGLGLTIVHKIVQLMDGTLDVVSAPGKGSTFTVRLKIPFATDQQIERHHREEDEDCRGKSLDGKRVLVAEDQKLNQIIIVRLLEAKGMTVMQTSNGQEVIDAFEHSQPGSIDAILMDVRMPVHDGLYATRQIRKSAHPDAATVPIIAMTANAFEEDRKKSRDAGMTDYLVKPINLDRLYGTLEKNISQR